MEKKTKSGQTKGIRIGGIITEIRKNSFMFDFRTRNRNFKEKLEELRPRVQKIENKTENYFVSPAITTQRVHLVYLNWESAEGKYKEQEYNLPYQIFTENGIELYRQSTIEKKDEIFNRLEKAAIEQGLRN